MSGKLTGMMFWTDAWMTSRARLLMNVEERGVYLEMLFAAWQLGGSLPDNYETIKRITLISDEVWSRCWPAIKPFWKKQGKFLVNEKLSEVYTHASSAHEIYRDRAIKGAKGRWSKQPATNASSIASSNTPSNASSNAQAIASVSVSVLKDRYREKEQANTRKIEPARRVKLRTGTGPVLRGEG